MVFTESTALKIRRRILQAKDITNGEKLLLIKILDDCDPELCVTWTNLEAYNDMSVADPSIISKFVLHLQKAGYVKVTHFVEQGTTRVRRCIQVNYDFIYPAEMRPQAQSTTYNPDSDLPFGD